MTRQDARKLADVISFGACEPSLERLARYLNQAFPEFYWEYAEDEKRVWVCPKELRRERA